MRWPFQSWFESKKVLLDSMDRSRIYVENVRSFLGVNTKVASWLCEKACRDGLLEHWVALENPSEGRTLLEFKRGEEPKELEIVDEVAQQLGAPSHFELSELKRVDFYKGAE
jgi:hypothetical protein